MIPQIKEINFPEYATLSTATATLTDMGDKTITAQVKIDGSIVPDFSYDWEIEFQGERYIQPLREPQASKGNESISSIIDLTFYNKGIYGLKRYFFVDLATTESGTSMVDKYIVPLSLNLGEFIIALNNVLQYYYGDTYRIQINPKFEYDDTDKKLIDINYTHIWDLLTQMYELYKVRWVWETSYLNENEQYYTIKVGYDAPEASHIFKYGFEGGLLKFERQVQSQEIRNQVFGRGGSKNLPYRYFKKQDPNNTAWEADPDWIPELENISFSELRGKTFRDYVKGWKAKHYGGEVMANPTDAYEKGYTDEVFSPIEYVEDKESIANYGLIQGGLDNNEDIYPNIQKVVIDGIGRVDEVIAVEQILDDDSDSSVEGDTDIDGENEIIILPIGVSTRKDADVSLKYGNAVKVICQTPDLQVPKGYKGNLATQYSIVVNEEYVASLCTGEGSQGVVCDFEYTSSHQLSYKLLDFRIIDKSTGYKIIDFDKIPPQKDFYIEYEVEVTGFQESYDNIKEDAFGSYGQSLTIRERTIYVDFDGSLECSYFNGDIISNYTETGRIRKTLTVEFGKTKETTLSTDIFTITQDKSFILDVNVNVIAFPNTSAYVYEISEIKAINVDTKQDANILDLSKGTYYLDVVVAITNAEVADGSEPHPFLAYTIELLPTYIYYSSDIDEHQRTFNIWIKDIWGSKRIAGENDNAYAERVWTPILGDHLGNEAKVIFSSGLLSGHSDYEFPIVSYAYDDTQTYNGVKSHWRLTLAKSDAEVESTGNWLPSTQVQGKSGDYFFFVGIDIPHQYVLWAEELVDKWKRDNMPSMVKPTIVVQTDKVRLNQLNDEEISSLIRYLRVGHKMRVADFRFIKGEYEVLHLQSITYSWDEDTTMFPNVNVVLSEVIMPTQNILKETKLEISNIKVQSALVQTELDKVQLIAQSANKSTNILKTQILSTQSTATEARRLASTVSNALISANESISMLDSRLRVVENASSGNILFIKKQVDANTKLLKTHSEQIKAIETNNSELEARVSNVERRVTIAVVTPTENNN